MLGLFLIYFIWRAFAELAFQFDKNRWVFGIGGIALYYLGAYLGFKLLVLLSSFSGDILRYNGDVSKFVPQQALAHLSQKA